ncbi:TB2/DP1, HVA22 family-domain-containing protein [Xylariaceae sp. FL1019]|nr:TB2/DP1, HVA22 family-domain-containing protein [Xylariaceae sp. FL1019]
MFNIIAHFFASIASFLFPLFASYKALKTSDPAQLTPWLMYWSVLSCALLVESWVDFILVWIPFYSWIRLVFLLWLVLPNTQGSRLLYEEYLDPYLQENEHAIEDFIASAHDRFKAFGLKSLRAAVELVRTKVFGLPPTEREEDTRAAGAAPQGYTQALLARFSVPAARWAANNAGTAGHDFYNLLSGAVSAAAGVGASAKTNVNTANTLIPENIGGAQEKMTFIASQREKLAFMMGALDREAAQLQRNEEMRRSAKPGSMSLDGGQELSRPPSGYSTGSVLSKSRSEVDFEKIDAPSGGEDDEGLRRRGYEEDDDGGHTTPARSWGNMFWGTMPTGTSTGYQQQQ